MNRILLPLLFLFAGTANAAIIEFVPPNDPTGHVFSTNSNDGWGAGRGVVFQATADGTFSSIGVYQDLPGVDLSYTLSQTTSATGDISTGETVLASGNAISTTNGLEWIDFPIGPVSYSAGNYYHIEFSFQANSNQNFFYDNNDVQFSQDGFDVIDGTQGGNTGNTVMPAIRLDTGFGINAVNTTPVPTLDWRGITVLFILLAGLAFYRQRKRLT